ncbi:hypothetical protein [Streptomyces sp. NPDC059008]|uniref:hypothetical protein n=1 Tax=Streptomyces sp. NPDC059008 TaxID=3346693 RepID=UPI0036B353FF
MKPSMRARRARGRRPARDIIVEAAVQALNRGDVTLTSKEAAKARQACRPFIVLVDDPLHTRVEKDFSALILYAHGDFLEAVHNRAMREPSQRRRPRALVEPLSDRYTAPNKAATSSNSPSR